MKKAELIKQLKTLKELKPDKEWRNLSKNQLLTQISTMRPIEADRVTGAEVKAGIFAFPRSYKIASVFCAIMLLFSGVIGMAQSASVSSPLYSVKIGLEKAIVAIAPQDVEMDLKIALTQQIINDLSKSEGNVGSQLPIKIASENLNEISNQLKNIDHPSNVAVVSDKVQQKTSQIKNELKAVPIEKIDKSEVKNSIQNLENQVNSVESQAFALKSEAEEKINNCPVYLEENLASLEQKLDLPNLATSTKENILAQLQKANDYVANNHCVDALVILDSLQKQLDN